MINKCPGPRAPLQPEEIQPWTKLIRRLRMMAYSDGYSVVSLSIILDPNGNPVQWLAPLTRRFEPRQDSETLLKLLSPSEQNDPPADE